MASRKSCSKPRSRNSYKREYVGSMPWDVEMDTDKRYSKLKTKLVKRPCSARLRSESAIESWHACENVIEPRGTEAAEADAAVIVTAPSTDALPLETPDRLPAAEMGPVEKTATCLRDELDATNHHHGADAAHRHTDAHHPALVPRQDAADDTTHPMSLDLHHVAETAMTVIGRILATGRRRHADQTDLNRPGDAVRLETHPTALHLDADVARLRGHALHPDAVMTAQTPARQSAEVATSCLALIARETLGVSAVMTPARATMALWMAQRTAQELKTRWVMTDDAPPSRRIQLMTITSTFPFPWLM